MIEQKLRLWADASREAEHLKKSLEEKGYSVTTVPSGSPKPVVVYGETRVAGYGEIRTTFFPPVPSYPVKL